jgi:hypothetical protein
MHERERVAQHFQHGGRRMRQQLVSSSSRGATMPGNDVVEPLERIREKVPLVLAQCAIGGQARSLSDVLRGGGESRPSAQASASPQR